MLGPVVEWWRSSQRAKARREGQEARARNADYLDTQNVSSLYGWAGTLNPYRREDLRAAWRDGFLG